MASEDDDGDFSPPSSSEKPGRTPPSPPSKSGRRTRSQSRGRGPAAAGLGRPSSLLGAMVEASKRRKSSALVDTDSAGLGRGRSVARTTLGEDAASRASSADSPPPESRIKPTTKVASRPVAPLKPSRTGASGQAKAQSSSKNIQNATSGQAALDLDKTPRASQRGAMPSAQFDFRPPLRGNSPRSANGRASSSAEPTPEITEGHETHTRRPTTPTTPTQVLRSPPSPATELRPIAKQVTQASSRIFGSQELAHVWHQKPIDQEINDILSAHLKELVELAGQLGHEARQVASAVKEGKTGPFEIDLNKTSVIVARLQATATAYGDARRVCLENKAPANGWSAFGTDDELEDGELEEGGGEDSDMDGVEAVQSKGRERRVEDRGEEEEDRPVTKGELNAFKTEMANAIQTIITNSLGGLGKGKAENPRKSTGPPSEQPKSYASAAASAATSNKPMAPPKSANQPPAAPKAMLSAPPRQQTTAPSLVVVTKGLDAVRLEPCFMTTRRVRDAVAALPTLKGRVELVYARQNERRNFVLSFKPGQGVQQLVDDHEKELIKACLGEVDPKHIALVTSSLPRSSLVIQHVPTGLVKGRDFGLFSEEDVQAELDRDEVLRGIKWVTKPYFTSPPIRLQQKCTEFCPIGLTFEDPQGLISAQLLKKKRVYMFGQASILARRRPPPQWQLCQLCGSTAHTASSMCKARRCLHCSGRHAYVNHREECAKCRTDGVADEDPCPHPPTCRLCAVEGHVTGAKGCPTREKVVRGREEKGKEGEDGEEAEGEGGRKRKRRGGRKERSKSRAATEDAQDWDKEAEGWSSQKKSRSGKKKTAAVRRREEEEKRKEQERTAQTLPESGEEGASEHDDMEIESQ